MYLSLGIGEHLGNYLLVIHVAQCGYGRGNRFWFELVGDLSYLVSELLGVNCKV